MVTHRLKDPDQWMQDVRLRPPDWITQRDTLWFLLTVPGGRIPGESRYVALGSSNSVPVNVSDTIGSALPEICLVLPSGEVLDFVQYDGNIVLPAVVPQDEWASISALLTVVFDEPPIKRIRV